MRSLTMSLGLGRDYGRGEGRQGPMLLNIDYGKCEGCGGCAEAFPQFFEMRDDKAWVINNDTFGEAPDYGVLTICPYYAISVE